MKRNNWILFWKVINIILAYLNSHKQLLVDAKLHVYWHCCCWLGWVLQTRLGTVRQAGAGAGAGAELPGTTASHTLSLLVSHTCTEGVSVVPSLKPMV